jgi:hypothetical protein
VVKPRGDLGRSWGGYRLLEFLLLVTVGTAFEDLKDVLLKCGILNVRNWIYFQNLPIFLPYPVRT